MGDPRMLGKETNMADLDWGAVAVITVSILLAQIIMSVYYAIRTRVGVARKRQAQTQPEAG